MKNILEKAEIESILTTLKAMLKDSKTRLNICETREKNYVFYYLYNITKEYIKEVLSKLEVKDFIAVTENTNPNFPKELLYIFTKTVVLTDAKGEERIIQLYIKFSFNEKKKYIVTVSFHEAEHDFI